MPARFSRLSWLDGPRLVLFAFVVLGVAYTWLHRDYPIIRNSLLYAGIAEAVIDEGILSPHVLAQAHKKPLGFAILAAPLVAWLGPDAGLKAGSALATALWAMVTLLFLRRRAAREAALNPIALPLALIISLFSALVIYQFPSAFPDTLFAALFLVTAVFLDLALSKHVRWWHGITLAAALLLSVCSECL